MPKKRPADVIPAPIAGKVLFASDRTCCVCRIRGKPVQIHHIDEIHSNHDMANLAVLCLDCHTDTQIRGGFHRKLDADQVILYRNDWVAIIARERATKTMVIESGDEPDIGFITSELEILKENEEYELLASTYDNLGNRELRDKYIEIALAADSSDFNIVDLRSLQGRLDLIPEDVKQRQVALSVKHKDWSQLARLYRSIKDSRSSAYYYCKGITESLSGSNLFSAAYYLKEMTEELLHVPLFEEAYGKFVEAGDLWWQVRSLQELGWSTELKALLLSKRDAIEASNDLVLQGLLFDALGEEEKGRQAKKAWMRGLRKVGALVGQKTGKGPKKGRGGATAGHESRGGR